jgi:glutamate receptor-interacting protein
MVVTDIKAGSPAHRASVKVGDLVLAIDNHPIQHFNVDIMLKENKNDCITLTLRRNILPDFVNESQSRNNAVYANFNEAANAYRNGYLNENL